MMYILDDLATLVSPCRICMRKCLVERFKNQVGYCRSSIYCSVYSYFPHFGEEPPISGCRGSGAIFFSNCSMSCIYCQNHKFSQEYTLERPEGIRRASYRMLCRVMFELKEKGCHNINLVSPTHYIYEIVKAIISVKSELGIPIVYNTGGYDSPELVRLLNGLVDVYLVDMRYADEDMAIRYSMAPGYVENNRRIIKEMFRQVGLLQTDDKGLAKRGLIIRLLILPNDISGTKKTLRFIKYELSNRIHISVMSQYYPAYKTYSSPEINRKITEEEYKDVINELDKLGFENGWIQEFTNETSSLCGTNIKPVYNTEFASR